MDIVDGSGTLAPLESLFACPKCRAPLKWSSDEVACQRCTVKVPRTNGIPRFIQDDVHDSFALQWERFWDVQIDSHNGTQQSRNRLLDQSRMEPSDFRGKTVLEVGCGSGRFTEVLLAMGARVVSLDYSGAVDVNARLNADHIRDGSLVCAQGNVFELPLRERAFDIVLCYGVIQHTSDATRAMGCLWEHVKVGGLLLVDRYQLDLRHVMPFKYALRPVTKRLPADLLLKGVEAYCRAAIPFQKVVLARLTGNGVKRWLRLLINRSPNSVYPIHLALAGELDPEQIVRWSVLETFDQYHPRFDDPCTGRTWRKEVADIPSARVVHCDSAGQGNVAVLERSA